jgi:hypothetical protein
MRNMTMTAPKLPSREMYHGTLIVGLEPVGW